MNDLQALIGRQRAEFALASRYFLAKFLTQLAVAGLGVASTTMDGKDTLYWAALLTLIFLLTWLLLEMKYRSVRACAERARRATLIMEGLGKTISPYELNDIRECMSSSATSGKKQEDPAYFASMAPPGPSRLGEMLEESAYWTLGLQRISKVVMWCVCAVVILAAMVAIVVTIPQSSTETLMEVVRISCGVIAFAVGADMIGAARAYSDTVSTLNRLIHRFDAARARGWQEPDLLLMLSDYNAAVENTPLSLPFVYRLNKKRLSQNWLLRQQDYARASNHGS